MTDTDLIKLCKEIADKAHRNQFRGDGKTPYIDHVRDVASRLRRPRLKAIAWLHDVLEDGHVTVTSLLHAGVPEDIVRDVHMLTRGSESYEEYVTGIHEMPSQDAAQVKMADILSNLGDNPTKSQVKRYTKALALFTGLQTNKADKMYIVVRQHAIQYYPDLVAVSVAHATAIAFLKWRDDSAFNSWVEKSFKKVIVTATDSEFEVMRNGFADTDFSLVNESNVDDTICMVVHPRQNSKALRRLPLYKPGKGTCYKCGGKLRKGKALMQTIVPGLADIGPGQTMHFGGPGQLIDCMKCKDCGHSFVECDEQS
jgi:hypothetical protein